MRGTSERGEAEREERKGNRGMLTKMKGRGGDLGKLKAFSISFSRGFLAVCTRINTANTSGE